jgi:hypothetical protein
MDGTQILNTASGMLETHGEHAKFLIAQKMDDAMLAGDGQAYDDWCMIAKAMSLMTMARKDAAAKPAQKADVILPAAFKAA